MNFKLNKWTEAEYTELVSYLKRISDKQYREFHSRIVPNKDNILGVRMPVLRKIAKEISKGDWRGYINYSKSEYYEEVMLKGIVIGLAKVDYKEFVQIVDDFSEYVDNWAVCDCFCNGLKLINEFKDEFFEHICEYINFGNQWKVRISLVIFLNFYIDDKYLHEILKLCDNIITKEYYVKMAQAWLISYIYIKFPGECFRYLKNSRLDDWTYNKSIQKIRESLRVSKKDKEMLKKMKRK